MKRSLHCLMALFLLAAGCSKQQTASPASPPSPVVEPSTTVTATPPMSAAAVPCDQTAMQAFQTANETIVRAYCATAKTPMSSEPTEWALVEWTSGPTGGELVWVYLKDTSAMICGQTTSCWSPADASVDGMGGGPPAKFCGGGGALDLKQLSACMPGDAAAAIWTAMNSSPSA